MISKKAFVHIGFPKTGTTSLQAFFYQHRADFLRHGVLYPETGRLWHAQHELAGLFQSEEKRLYWVKTNLEKPYLQMLQEELQDSRNSTLILSSEAFTFIDKHGDLKDFLNKCGFQDIEIVCVFKRQDLWMESAFTQIYKIGLVDFNFKAYLDSQVNRQKRIDYISYLEPWEKVFGKESIGVEILDHEIGHKDIVPPVLNRLGVEGMVHKYSRERHNPALAPDALHYAHLIHKENGNELLGWFLQLLEEYSEQQRNPKLIFLENEERENLLGKYNSINRKLGEKYLGRETVFSDFEGFENPVMLCPELHDVDFGPVCLYVMNEIKKRAVFRQKAQWLERLQYLENQNARIEDFMKSLKRNKKKISRNMGPDSQGMDSVDPGNRGCSKVAIITRTKNRPIMLPRVLRSIGQQTFKDFIWVLVNDSGDWKPIEEIAEQAEELGINVKVLHREKSIGMEAASNDGVRQSNSQYIVIHDDDDTWEAEFLERTVGYLDESLNVPGVITWSNRIDENIENNCIRFSGVSPYNHWLKNVYLSDLAIENRFPPISFLFRRSAYEAVGGFDEELPVLGDWDFHLKILMKGDIHVLPYVLANYHFRVNLEKDNIYGNTVTSGVEKHILYDAIYRNRKLREDIKNGTSGIGSLLALGQMFRRTNHLSDVFARLTHASHSNRLLSFIRKVLKV